MEVQTKKLLNASNPRQRHENGVPVSKTPIVIDREKTCPFLIRAFTNHGDHHSAEDFAEKGKEPKSEIQMYTWKDASLRELTDLLKEVDEMARRRTARVSFAFVYPNRRGVNILRQVGTVFASGKRSLDDKKTLEELGFQIGDFLDLAILT